MKFNLVKSLWKDDELGAINTTSKRSEDHPTDNLWESSTVCSKYMYVNFSHFLLANTSNDLMGKSAIKKLAISKHITVCNVLQKIKNTFLTCGFS